MATTDVGGGWDLEAPASGARVDRDALGDLFRAVAPVPGTGSPQRLLVRRLDGEHLDPAAFRSIPGDPIPPAPEAARQRLEVTWVGAADGTACLAHSERPGVTLHRLLDTARRRGEPVGERPALAIVRDLVRALGELEALRPGTGHGFLLPHLVWVADEGTARLVGAEAAPALRAALGSFGFGPRLGPFATHLRSRGDALAADDLYSVAALLVAMLTGDEPPVDPAALPSSIAAARFEVLDEPLQAALTRLLVRSLSAEPEARPDLSRWRSELQKLLAGCERQPTAFDLALYLRTHHRSELAVFDDRAEAEEERTADGAAPRETVPAPGPAARSPRASSDRPEQAAGRTARATVPATAVGTEVAAAAGHGTARLEPRRREKRATRDASSWLLLAAGVAILSLITELALTRSRSSAPQHVGESAAVTGLGGVATDPPVAPPGTVETPETALEPPDADTPDADTPEIETPEAETPEAGAGAGADLDPQELERLVDQGLGERAENLHRAYEERVDDLERQIDELEPSTETAATGATPAPPARTPPPEARAAQAPTPETAPAPTAPPAGPTAAPQRSSPKATSAAPDEAADRERERTATAVADAAPPAGPEESADDDPTVRREPSPPPRAEPPELVQAPELTYPRRARRLNREAEVQVRVLVDARGRVVDAELVPGQEPGYGFGEVALEAVRTARYRPATRGGEPVEAWTTITLAYRLR